jgi:response regulator of citrate/malate metabolism
METILITSKKELAQTIREVLDEKERENSMRSKTQSFTINQIAKKLGRAHTTIKRFVEAGVLKTTLDGRIPETELQRFINTGN